MNSSSGKLEIFKKYFLEPLGWMLGATILLLFLLSHFQIIKIGSLVNINYLLLGTLSLFTYSLGEWIERLPHKPWSILRFFILSFFSGSIIVLFYVYVAGFEWSRYKRNNFFEGPIVIELIILSILFISSFLIILHFSKEEKKKDEQQKLIEKINKQEWVSFSEFAIYSFGLFVVFMTGMWLRIRELPYLAFWTDESTTVLVAKQIIDGNGQRLLNGEFYDRAVIYHHYLAWFMDNFSFLGLFSSTRLANTPFFIIAFVGIFLLGKYVYSKQAGFVAATLFSFSWISISLFREARFYEMFLAIFILLCFVIINLDHLIGKTKFYEKGISVIEKVTPFVRGKIWLSIWAIVILAAISFDTQSLTIFIIYPVILFGVLLFIFRGNLRSLIISTMGFFMLLLALVIGYGEDFQLSYLFKYPQPDWKQLYADLPFSEFWIFLMANQYNYLIVIGVLIVPLLFYTLKRRDFFIVAIAVGWYSIIALQGYRADVVRYFYPALPFAVIAIGIIFHTYQEAIKEFVPKSVFTAIGIFLIAMTFYGGYVESQSAIERNSRNPLKNSSYDVAMNYLISTGLSGIATFMTDNTFSMTYYLTFNTAPNYVVINSDFVPFDADKKEKYTAARQIDYREITEVPKPAYYIFVYQKDRMGEQFLTILKEMGGKEVYKEGSRMIYYFPKTESKDDR